MTDNVKALLDKLAKEDFLPDSEGALIIKKVLALGIDNLDSNEITAFSLLVLPIIRKHECRCWRCQADVCDRVINEFYEFLKNGLCPVCNEKDFIRDAVSL